MEMRNISMFAAALPRHAPAPPGRTALVGHWRKNEQTGRLECHWSLEPVSDDIGAIEKADEFSDISLQAAA
jgi:hypothetical protein